MNSATFMLELVRKYFSICILWSAILSFNIWMSAGASAEENISIGKKIVPGFKVEDEVSQEYIYSVLTTYQILNSKLISEVYGRVDGGRFNFIFTSGRDFIKDQRVSRDAVAILTSEAQEKILNLPTNTDECYIQTFNFSNADRLFLGVHNEPEDSPERVFQCFAVTLWYFTFESLDGVDAADWRKSISEIFSSLIEKR
ncbi:hypothetical protein [Litoreibacter roseus]|uniref:Uncharacterized protein n=1 Tax=Litoreibacter roseus TaxID=2601869 RepID=A0A6N6JHG2_9RHOB|nr:hypothetical protein [Litoreibacter roseus]GFE65555.1 hypothetical protein KIN_26290 [Litoreibacter roseus]